ncbi:sel1 repeat family protein [Geomesophilobacter sediminis]|uniref:Sel1 repeat family protein n=1 Tax=Geomesophilobacter sediminis TaxID=2798584 RepID=A0A8J7M1C7_9BACT|nr:sel1 repeat family protein [Geomesophilobacter sediminis]MBJ6726841.1 sel1 repeat family protein [Geomesophilobacter sediminis]
MRLRKYLEPARRLFLLAFLLSLCAFPIPSVFAADDAGSAAAARGADLYRAGKFAEALASFREAAEASPESGEYPYLIGLMCERGEGTSANEVEAARYYRGAWKNGNEQAHERLTTMYSSAATGGQKAPPPALPIAAAAVAAVPAAASSTGDQGVIEIPLEVIASLKGVHFRSSHDDKYRLIVACPDRCSDLADRTREVAAALGARVADAGAAGEAAPDRTESIAYQAVPDRPAGGASAESPRSLELTLTCQGWCRITRVVAKSIAEQLVVNAQSSP